MFEIFFRTLFWWVCLLQKKKIEDEKLWKIMKITYIYNFFFIQKIFLRGFTRKEAELQLELYSLFYFFVFHFSRKYCTNKEKKFFFLNFTFRKITIITIEKILFDLLKEHLWMELNVIFLKNSPLFYLKKS